MTDKFMENIAERYDKLSKQARNEFWLGYNQNNLDIKNADVYDLLKDVLEWEKIKKEEIKMIDEKKVGIDEAKKGSEETKIQVVDRKKQALLIKQEVSIAEMKEQATILFQSGYFTDVQSVAQAYVKIKAGQELGFPAFFSLQNFFILPGKPPASSGQVMGALAKRSGFDYRILEHSNTICTVKIFGLGARN